eukprot:symbB.v1.2.019286.t1/scaffold1573.1/size110978/12
MATPLVLGDVTNREMGRDCLQLPMTPRKCHGGYAGCVTPTPKAEHVSPRVDRTGRPSSARQRVQSEGSALRQRGPSMAHRTPRASILELPPEERVERLKALGEPERLGRLPEAHRPRKSLGPPQRRTRANTVRPGRDRQMTSQCASPRARKKAPPPGQVRWRI